MFQIKIVSRTRAATGVRDKGRKMAIQEEEEEAMQEGAFKGIVIIIIYNTESASYYHC